MRLSESKTAWLSSVCWRRLLVWAPDIIWRQMVFYVLQCCADLVRYCDTDEVFTLSVCVRACLCTFAWLFMCKSLEWCRYHVVVMSYIFPVWRVSGHSLSHTGDLILFPARKSYLSKLEPVANAALRLSLGAFCTSPIPSLQALSGEPPLSIRRDQLALQFYYKLNSNIKNPAYNTIFNNTNPLYSNETQILFNLSIYVYTI